MNRPWRKRDRPTPGAGVTWAKPPAQASPPAPGTTPAAGRAAGPPDTPMAAPLPGPQRTLSVHYFDDGHAEMIDHRRRRKIVLPPDDARDWDGWLKGLTQ